MNSYYITADDVGIETGGGKVTSQELLALHALNPEGCFLLDGDILRKLSYTDPEPWRYDFAASRHYVIHNVGKGDIAHFYAGTFSDTVKTLKSKGCKVSYTAAAHDVSLSKTEHEKLGLSYNYPHLTDPELFKRYVSGYLEADLLICPSEHSKRVMIGFGAKAERIKVIPHGVEIPKEELRPYPEKFTLGYMGAVGPDKGLRCLLEAWKTLNFPDAELVLAGRDSNSPFVTSLIKSFGGGNIRRMGWVNHISEFYNSISCYVQPSVSEGFGCEVLEAMAYGRPVICSTGAGSCDVVPQAYAYDSFDITELCNKIEYIRLGNTRLPQLSASLHRVWQELALDYTWDKIQSRYVSAWKELLS